MQITVAGSGAIPMINNFKWAKYVLVNWKRLDNKDKNKTFIARYLGADRQI